MEDLVHHQQAKQNLITMATKQDIRAFHHSAHMHQYSTWKKRSPLQVLLEATQTRGIRCTRMVS